MADIKQYRMEKNDGYESRLQKHRAKVMKTIMAAIGVILVIVIVIISVIFILLILNVFRNSSSKKQRRKKKYEK